MTTRRTCLGALGGLAVGSALAQPAGFGSRPIRIVVPFGAGGAADVFARLVADRLAQVQGWRIVVENRPGAGGTIGAAAAARAPADGTTLLLVTSSHTINETLLADRGYALLADFAPIIPFNRTGLILNVRAGLPARSAPELLALLRAQPDALTFGSTGIGTPLHLAGELLMAQTGLRWRHVPYRAGSEAYADLSAGRIDAIFQTLRDGMTLAETGRVRSLATTGAARSTTVPALPTMIEAGVPGFVVEVLIGLVAPSATPPDILALLNREIGAILRRPDIGAAWAEQGAKPLPAAPAEWGTLLAEDVARWQRLIRANDIRP